MSGIRPVEAHVLEGPEGKAGVEPVSAAARAAAYTHRRQSVLYHILNQVPPAREIFVVDIADVMLQWAIGCNLQASLHGR